jgi:mRNA-degrading endonuclease RelE of RelBE toxin-antitoxin system
MDPSFAGRYSPQFLADLKRLDPPVQARIVDAIETKLLPDPFKHGKKLAGKVGPGQWQFRVGDYRVRFDIEGRTLFFYRVRHRREIYE